MYNQFNIFSPPLAQIIPIELEVIWDGRPGGSFRTKKHYGECVSDSGSKLFEKKPVVYCSSHPQEARLL